MFLRWRHSKSNLWKVCLPFSISKRSLSLGQMSIGQMYYFHWWRYIPTTDLYFCLLGTDLGANFCLTQRTVKFQSILPIQIFHFPLHGLLNMMKVPNILWTFNKWTMHSVTSSAAEILHDLTSCCRNSVRCNVKCCRNSAQCTVKCCRNSARSNVKCCRNSARFNVKCCNTSWHSKNKCTLLVHNCS